MLYIEMVFIQSPPFWDTADLKIAPAAVLAGGAIPPWMLDAATHHHFSLFEQVA